MEKGCNLEVPASLPEDARKALESAVDASLRDGFSGAHVLVEAGWSLGRIRNVDAWWELEHVLGEMALLRQGHSLLGGQFGLVGVGRAQAFSLRFTTYLVAVAVSLLGGLAFLLRIPRRRAEARNQGGNAWT